jgi:hypothetical protein
MGVTDLRKFRAIIGYDCDCNRTLLDRGARRLSPRSRPTRVLLQPGARSPTWASPVSQRWVGHVSARSSGNCMGPGGLTSAPLRSQDFILPASNYRTVVVRGENTLLSADDTSSSTASGIGSPYTVLMSPP